jgi:hypothetical protein
LIRGQNSFHCIDTVTVSQSAPRSGQPLITCAIKRFSAGHPFVHVSFPKLLEINPTRLWHDRCNCPLMRHTNRPQNEECRTLTMTPTDIALADDMKQVAVFCLPITAGTKIKLNCRSFTKPNNLAPTVPRPRRLAFILRMAHLKLFRREPSPSAT